MTDPKFDSSDVAVDELVGLLSKWAPSELDSLREKYPASQNFLKPGLLMGDSSSEIGIRIEVCLSGLRAAADACQKTMVSLKHKLKFADRTQFIGQLLTTIGGASIFAVLAVNVPDFARYAAAVLGLGGSVLSLVSQHSMRSLGSKDVSVMDSYSQLSSYRASSLGLLRELEIARRLGGDADTLELINQANVLAENVGRATDVVIP